MGVFMMKRSIFVIVCPLIILLIIFSNLSVFAQTYEKKYPEVSLLSTEKRMLHSNIVDQDFEIYVSLPYRYSYSDTTYPVLFSLDANVKFGLMSNVVNNLSGLTREIPEIIVVGIAYPIKDIADWAAWRKRDTTPTRNLTYDKEWADYLNNATGRDDIIVQSGGADKFLSFIRDELIPFIESNYRVSSMDRALSGTSSSGLFTLYALFQHPELFQRYFASSPSINWDEPYMYKLENDFAANHKDLPVKLFMCVGGLDKLKHQTKTTTDCFFSFTSNNKTSMAIQSQKRIPKQTGLFELIKNVKYRK
jgi:predicted alpha/beta superfamily hydrolase